MREKQIKIVLKNSLSIVLMVIILAGVFFAEIGKTEAPPVCGNVLLVNELFAATGITVKEIKLQVWGQINNTLLTNSQDNNSQQKSNAAKQKAQNINVVKQKVNPANSMANSMANSIVTENISIVRTYEKFRQTFELNPQFQTVEKDYSGFYEISHLEAKKQGSWQLCLQEKQLSEKREEKYISLLLTTNSVCYAGEVYDLLKGELSDLGVKQEIGITFCGRLNGKISGEEEKRITGLMQKSARAYYVEGVKNEELTSLSFYSTAVEGYLEINGQKINLNIAFSYNEEEDCTYLYVGLPLIFQEY